MITWLCYLAMGYIQMGIMTFMHDCTHSVLFKEKWKNSAFGTFAIIPMFLTDALRGCNDSLGKLPIGWNNVSLSFEGTAIDIFLASLQHIAGWLLTALAISLGAPFWFDLLNKAVSVRHGMRKPQ